MSGIGSLNNGNLLNNLNQLQQSTATSLTRLSTGSKITTAADNPSGLAIYNTLQGQVNAYNVSSDNVQTALNALNVAQGAISATSDALQRLNSLAVQASNDLLSPAQRSAIQTEANAVVSQANFVASSTTFNGANLLNGSIAGPQAGAPAQAQITNNDQIASGGGIITQITAASANFQNPNGPAQGFGGTGTTDSTISIQIVNNGGTAQAVATVYDNATGQTVQSAPVSSGGVISGFENVNIQLGTFTTADVGTTSTVQIAQNQPANNTNSALTVQSGPGQGSTVQVGIAAPTSGVLQISNLDFSSSLSATNAIGQIQNALTQLGNQQATIGAQQVSLQEDVNNNNIAAVNTQASAASIGDTNIGAEFTNATKNQIQQQLGYAVLAQNNTFAAAVLGLFK